MPAPLLLPVLLAAGLGAVLLRRRKDAPDTPASELFEALSEAAGQPIDCSIRTLSDGEQVLSISALDPIQAAEGAMGLNLPAILIIANVDGKTLDMIPHPKRRRGEAVLMIQSDGELLEMAP